MDRQTIRGIQRIEEEIHKRTGISSARLKQKNENGDKYIKLCNRSIIYGVQRWEIARSKNKEVVRVVEKIKKAEVKVLRGEEQQIERDLVLKKGKVYMLKDETLRVEIIQLQHNIPVAGHREKWKITELVTRNYQQPEVIRDVGKYVEECNICQRMKNRIKVLVGKLKLNKVLEKLQTYLTVDFITKLLLVAGKDVISVVCDRLSKMIYFMATTEGISAEGLVRLFRDNVQKLHGLPEIIVSDRRSQFATEMTKELNNMLGIETKLSTSFHPQTDEQIEYMNQELEQYL